jgi:hypothetical protein
MASPRACARGTSWACIDGPPDFDPYCSTTAKVLRQHFNCSNTLVGVCFSDVAPEHRGERYGYCGGDCPDGDAAWAEAYYRCPGICATPPVPGGTYDQWWGVCDVPIPDQPPLGSTTRIWHDLRSPEEKVSGCCRPPTGFGQ